MFSLDAEVITKQQLARILDCHPGTIDRMVRENNIPYIRIRTLTGSSSRVRFRRSEIEAWLARRIVANPN